MPSLPRSNALLALATVASLAAACSADPARIAPDTRPEELVLPPHVVAPALALPDGVRVRAATFNVHGGQNASAEAIGALLASLDLDVAGLQECPEATGQAIAAAAGFSHVAGDGQVLMSRAPIAGFEKVDLETRSFVRGTTAIDGIDFAIYVAHIGWNAAGTRQARLFVDEHLSKETNRHLVIVGDFNDEHYSDQITILERSLTDAFTTAKIFPGDRTSWPATEFDGSEGSQLIDLVFFPKDLGVIVTAADVLNLSPVLSDHKPTVAELLFPRDPERPFTSDPFAARREPVPGFPSELEAPNLLVNTGAEDDLSGWTGSGEATTETVRGERGPRTGARFFTGARSLSPSDSPLSSASQRVDLAEDAAAIDAREVTLFARGWLATDFDVEVDGDIRSNRPRPYDDGELVLEALDADDRTLAAISSGRSDPLAYHEERLGLDAPPGTRAARLTWITHRKPASGSGNDVAFDDLYLGTGRRAEHARSGGERVTNGGAEAKTLEGWTSTGWFAHGDLEPLGLMIYPPWTHSGAGHFVLGTRLDGPRLEGPIAGRMEQRIELAALASEQDAETLALRTTAFVRTYRAEAAIVVALELLDGDGTTWGRVAAAPVSAAEWTKVELLTRIPRGASAARVVIESEVTPGEWAFADGVSVLPEHVPTTE